MATIEPRTHRAVVLGRAAARPLNGRRAPSGSTSDPACRFSRTDTKCVVVTLWCKNVSTCQPVHAVDVAPFLLAKECLDLGDVLLLDDDQVVSLASRIEGRVAVEDVVSPLDVVLARAGSLLTRIVARSIDDACVPWVIVRDPLTCASQEGVCAVCFGLDPEDATWLADGDPIGARAATAIAREARRISERWFQTC